MAERLDKILSNAGLGSRKEITRLIRSGLVTVFSETVTRPDFKVDINTDKIYLNGETVSYKEHYHIMLNKPKNVITATEDSREKTVLDLISDEYPKKRLTPAGRLDKDTEGFVLLTTDGRLNHKITAPKGNGKHIEKIYYAETNDCIDKKLVEKFKMGVILEDGYLCKPANLNIIDNHSCRLTISEGKFHQVKRMFLAFNLTVTYLKRIKIGGLPLDESLSLGEYRELTDEEVKLLTN